MKTRSAGLVLVLVSGIVTLSMLLGLWLLQAALIGRKVQSARTAQSEAGLAAASGLEYAAARLVQDAYPGFDVSMRGRGDDWTCRQGSGVGVEGSSNPSYSHGEPWTDDGDGIFEPGTPEGTAFIDLDGDGRFSARSGRLRGTGGARNLAFALAIESPEGRLPVNAGILWTENVFDSADGVPDHRDLAISYHRGLAHALDNLGAILLPVTNDRRHWQAATGAPNPAHTFELSYLGHDLITFRPAGGYKDGAEIRSALAPLGYTEADLDAVLPHLDLGPCEIQNESSRSYTPVELNVIGNQPPFPVYVPVNLHAAPRPVLEALWRYVRSDIPTFEGETDGWNALYHRAGGNLSFEALSNPHPDWNPGRATLQIFPDEAAALAERVETLRKAGPLSWPSLLRDFHDPARAPLLFAADDAGFPPSAPLMRQGWTQAKARLAFQTVASADGGYHAAAGLNLRPATLEGLGIDRFPDALFPARAGCQQAFGMQFLRARPFPDTSGYPANADAAGTWTTWEEPFRILTGNPIGTQGGTVAPPARFSVSALGLSGPARGSRTGAFCAAERIEFACQEDFGNLSAGVNLGRRGIVPQGDTQTLAEWRHDLDHLTDNSGYGNDGAGRDYARITTTPIGNIRSCTTTAWGPPYWGLSRTNGAVALSPCEGGLQQGAVLYWGVKRDFDGTLNNGGAYTSGPRGDFLHEREPTSSLPDPPTPGQGPAPLATPYGSGDSFYLDDCQAPGLDGTPPVDPMGHLSIEARMSSGSSIRIQESGGGTPAQTISLGASREIPPSAPEEAVTVYRLSLQDSVIDGHWQIGGRNVTCTVRDGELGGGNPANQHVVLVVRSQANRTRFLIFIDGKPRLWETGSLVYDYDPVFTMTDKEQIVITRCAEVRLHAQSLGQSGVDDLYARDRFVRKGEFRSPLYALDAPARMKLAQWTGFRPPKADGTPAGSIVVQVTGYENTDGTGTSRTVTLPGDSGAVEDLAALGLSAAIRSFRYTVTFDVPTADIPPPLCDSPVFESIWFTFARPGRAPRWEEPR